MKTGIITLAVICVAVITGIIICSHHPKTSPPPVSTTASSPNLVAAPGDSKPDTTSTAASTDVDTLVSAQTTFSERRSLLNQLKEAGTLDSAITELKQRAAGHPNDAGVQIALGEAIMEKFPVQDFKEAAELGLQIDQTFNAALQLDPTNWEAQFSQATALADWPPQMNTGPEVIKQLSALIRQQEKSASQPQFAQTYVLLGDQYQKLGQPAAAAQTWRLGAKSFPNNTALRQRLNKPAAPQPPS